MSPARSVQLCLRLGDMRQLTSLQLDIGLADNPPTFPAVAFDELNEIEFSLPALTLLSLVWLDVVSETLEEVLWKHARACPLTSVQSSRRGYDDSWQFQKQLETGAWPALRSLRCKQPGILHVLSAHPRPKLETFSGDYCPFSLESVLHFIAKHPNLKNLWLDKVEFVVDEPQVVERPVLAASLEKLWLSGSAPTLLFEPLHLPALRTLQTKASVADIDTILKCAPALDTLSLLLDGSAERTVELVSPSLFNLKHLVLFRNVCLSAVIDAVNKAHLTALEVLELETKSATQDEAQQLMSLLPRLRKLVLAGLVDNERYRSLRAWALEFSRESPLDLRVSTRGVRYYFLNGWI